MQRAKPASLPVMDAHLLRIALACVDVAMAAVSWLILVCTYPDFARWRREGFPEAHENYTRRVGWVVGPLLILQMAGHLADAVLGGSWAGPALVFAVWGLTAFWSVRPKQPRSLMPRSSAKRITMLGGVSWAPSGAKQESSARSRPRKGRGMPWF